MSNLRLIEIENETNYVAVLYDLLAKRKYGISHKTMPNFEAHEKFVSKHPYVAWYFLKKNEEILGTCYVSFQNTIGLNSRFDALDDLRFVLAELQRKHEPLPEIPSIRSPIFTVNVGYSDSMLKTFFSDLAVDPIQLTYDVSTITDDN